MADRPILFSGPMVRALLDERKSQTRRALKPQPPEWATFCQQPSTLNILHQWVPSGLWAWSEEEQSPPRALRRWPIDAEGQHYWLRPPFAMRDRLWVRETWAPLSALTHNDPGAQALADGGFYRADSGTVDGEISKWKPSIFMPRHASRLTLTVTEVRIERLQSITEADAIAEGCFKGKASGRVFNSPGAMHLGGDEWANACDWYADLWENINGAGSWDANPWVAAYSFTVERRNIDASDIGIPRSDATSTSGGDHG